MKSKHVLLGALALGLWIDALADGIETAGDLLAFGLPGGAYASTFYLDDRAGRNEFYRSFLVTNGLTLGLKYSVDKTRPNGGEHSFPSGHTANAFQGASFIQQRYGWRYGLPAYLAAGFVGYSRVHAKAHYASDVLAGALIGLANGFWFTTPYKGVKVSLEQQGRYLGVQVTSRW